MSSRGALVAALLVVGGIVAYLLLGRGGDGPTGTAATEEAGARPSGGAATRPSGGAADDARPSGSTEEARFALRGKVEAEGQPVAGAVVTAVAADADADAEPHTTRTDPDGRFELLALPAGRHAISATAPGHLPAVLRSHDLRADASITLTLTPGGQPLRGTISDATGGALEGALVRVTPLSGIAALRRLDGFASLSSDDGAYAIHVAPGRYRVDVSHPDYAPEHRAVDVGPGAQSQDFALVPMGVIEGIVRHEQSGAPVPGAWVSWQRERLMSLEPGHRMSIMAGGGKVRADDEGRFTLRGLPPGTILLTARASRAVSEGPTAVPLAMAEHAAGIEVLVSRAADVRGRVVSKQDPAQGLADASVSAGVGASARTDAEGRFVLEGVLEGRVTLFASAEGWLPSFPGTALEVTADAPTEITLELERAPAIRGRVEPPTVAEVSIELRPETMRMGTGIGPGAMMAGGGATKTESDAEGRFELGPAHPGPTTVVARAADGRAGEVTVEVGPDGADEVVVRLEPRSVVRGTVRGATGQPVAQASVSLRRVREAEAADVRLTINGREMGIDTGTTTEDGHFEIGGVAAGDYEVSVTDRYGEPLPERDAAEGTAALAVVQGKDVDGLALVVDAPDGVIRGVVRTTDGEPVPDVWVQASMLPERARPKPRSPSKDGPSTRSETRMIVAGVDGASTGSNARPPVLTDDEGRFELTGLRDAEYELVAEGGVGGRRASKLARPGEPVTLELAELGAIEGVVTLDGEPLKRFVVRVEGPTSRVVQVRDAGGHFEIDRLDPGAYRLMIDTPGGSGTAEVAVDPGQTAKRDVVIERFVEVKGRVLDREGAPVKGATIMVGDGDEQTGSVSIQQDGSEEPITTDAEGRFTASCAAGQRVLMAIAPDRPGPLVVHFFVAQPGQDVDLGELHQRDAPLGTRREPREVDAAE